jgi:cytochrome c553
MNRWMLCLLLSLGWCVVAQAAGDAVAGQAKVAVCGACHGPDGNSLVPIFPKLAGQGERYLLKELEDIQAGRRAVPEMTGQLINLAPQDLADIAAFYAGKEANVGVADPALAAQGAVLYHGGRLDAGLPACSACHGPDGAGLAAAGFPRLSGQQAAYTVKQLSNFRSGARNDDGDTAIMRTVAGKLTDGDIAALAAYIQGLR